MKVKVGIIGDYDENRPSHRATAAALEHSAASLGLELESEWVGTEGLERGTGERLDGYDCLFCSPGTPYRSLEGALAGISYARENDIVFLGTCGGFQFTVIEFLKNVVKIDEVSHEEFDSGAASYAIAALSCSVAGQTMTVHIEKDSLIGSIYGSEMASERYHCRYGLNPEYAGQLRAAGLRISASDESGEARVVELPANRFYLATLFVPQMLSTKESPHPVITEFLRSGLERMLHNL